MGGAQATGRPTHPGTRGDGDPAPDAGEHLTQARRSPEQPWNRPTQTHPHPKPRDPGGTTPMPDLSPGESPELRPRPEQRTPHQQAPERDT